MEARQVRPIRMMIADSNQSFVNSMRESFQREDDLDVIAVAYNGSDALKAALCVQPDVLLTGLIMPILDGFALMEALSKVRLGTRIIVLTELTSDCFIRQAMALGASYYMIKPVDFSVLCNRIRDSMHFSLTGAAVSPAGNPDDSLNPLLAGIGVAPGTIGYKYLHFAITLATRMDKLSGRITTELYPAIARAFQTDQRNVERAIRHAISAAWSSGSAPPGAKPTNGELIARLAQQFASQRQTRR